MSTESQRVKLMHAIGVLALGAVAVTLGCQPRPTSQDLLSASTSSVTTRGGHEARTTAVARSDDPPMEAFYQLVMSAGGRSPTPSSEDATHVKTALVAIPAPTGALQALLAEPIVQKLADAVHEQHTKGTVRHPKKVTSQDAASFVQQLTRRKETLIQELAASTSDAALVAASAGGGPNFAKVLVAYYKAFGSGEFISRDGTNLSKPEFAGGASDDDIQGLATVFFEAFFDCMYWQMPVFCWLDQTVEHTYSDGVLKNPDIGDEEPASLSYTRKYVANFDIPDWKKPTIVTAGFATPYRVDKPGSSITRQEVQAIRRVGKVVGRQAKSLTGTLFGFLSNVNVSFVLGADFAIGDNETLLHLVQTLAEVSARRSVEYAAYSVLSRSAAATGVAVTRAGDAAAATRAAASPADQPLLELIHAFED